MNRLTRLSTLQYNMLKLFASNGLNHFLTYTDAQRLDQRPFRSMLIQEWVAYRPGRGFHLTKKGLHAIQDFETHDISRKNPNLPLTAYFDPDAYGLQLLTKKKKAAA